MSNAWKIKNCILQALKYHGHVHEYTSFLMEINIEITTAALRELYIHKNQVYTSYIRRQVMDVRYMLLVLFFHNPLESHKLSFSINIINSTLGFIAHQHCTYFSMIMEKSILF